MNTKNWFMALPLALLLTAGTTVLQAEERFSVNYEKYTLPNGLDVILHQDKSDPIVAVAIQYHVGSNREKPGKTGFAHLFEHMMFQESEHVPQDQFFRKIQNAGGTLNGGTNKDGTVYYEVVPRNAVEMVLWMEADRMGYLINTVTKEAFANQQNVVQNEKRQNYDNRPYWSRRVCDGPEFLSRRTPLQLAGDRRDERSVQCNHQRCQGVPCQLVCSQQCHTSDCR